MERRKIYELIDEAAPFALSAEYVAKYGAYDNSGMLVYGDEEVRGVLFSLDLSVAAVEEAKRTGANCIVTHHPAIFKPIKALAPSALLSCAQAGFSVISAHLNLDAAKGGIDESLMEGLGGKEPIFVLEELTGGGYGRIFNVPETSFGDFAERAKKTFRTDRIVCYGGREKIARVACFCGAGLDEAGVEAAFRAGADAVVSSDLKHHIIVGAVERGMNVMQLTHYAAECYGFERFYEKMKQKLPVPCFFFRDERFL